MYKSLFISDLHLGLPWSNSEKLFTLLENIEAEQLFLLGDIINVSASKDHPDVVEFIRLIQKKKWKIVYISGNHEDERDKLPAVSLSFIKELFSIENYIYRNAQTSIYLEHGHRFHSQSKFNRFLRQSVIYLKWLLSQRKKRNSQGMVSAKAQKETFYHRYIKPFAQKLLHHSFKSYILGRAKEKGCSVVVCGHFHIPEDRTIKNIRYLNCGDWVKSNSYIVENHVGEFFLQRV